MSRVDGRGEVVVGLVRPQGASHRQRCHPVAVSRSFYLTVEPFKIIKQQADE